jgi:cytidylate kinase
MKKNKILVDQFVKEQIERWKNRDKKALADRHDTVPVITIAMEPGSGGRIIGEQVAHRLGYDFFHRDIITAIAKNAKISDSVIDTMEKDRFLGVEDFISSLGKRKYLYPGSYLRHLIRVVGTIANHGHSVIVGRGANFILPQEGRFSVRVIAPLEIRIKNVARTYGCTLEKARKRVITRESKRRSFIKGAFNENIQNPLNYNMVINTADGNLDRGVTAIVGAVS